jgi:predicted Fe-S protein YdhL (DUF1289 family)
LPMNICTMVRRTVCESCGRPRFGTSSL